MRFFGTSKRFEKFTPSSRSVFELHLGVRCQLKKKNGLWTRRGGQTDNSTGQCWNFYFNFWSGEQNYLEIESTIWSLQLNKTKNTSNFKDWFWLFWNILAYFFFTICCLQKKEISVWLETSHCIYRVFHKNVSTYQYPNNFGQFWTQTFVHTIVDNQMKFENFDGKHKS